MKKLVLVLSLVCLYSCSANSKKESQSEKTQSSENISVEQEENISTMSGILTIGHEVRTFKPENSEEEYWIIDKSGTLLNKYDKLTGGIKNGKPVYATLKLEYQGKWDDGFAAEYPGVYFVKEVLEMKLPE